VNEQRHELKCWQESFKAIWEGRKHYEIRKSDRGFAVGDTLLLREFRPHKPCMGSAFIYSQPCGCKAPHGSYTGRGFTAKVTYMTPGGQWGLPDGICVLSIVKIRKAIREPSKPVRRARRKLLPALPVPGDR
jgi:hypothetical protein